MKTINIAFKNSKYKVFSKQTMIGNDHTSQTVLLISPKREGNLTQGS